MNESNFCKYLFDAILQNLNAIQFVWNKYFKVGFSTIIYFSLYFLSPKSLTTGLKFPCKAFPEGMEIIVLNYMAYKTSVRTIL